MVRYQSVLHVRNQFTLWNKCLLQTENHFIEAVSAARLEVAGMFRGTKCMVKWVKQQALALCRANAIQISSSDLVHVRAIA